MRVLGAIPLTDLRLLSERLFCLGLAWRLEQLGAWAVYMSPSVAPYALLSVALLVYGHPRLWSAAVDFLTRFGAAGQCHG